MKQIQDNIYIQNNNKKISQKIQISKVIKKNSKYDKIIFTMLADCIINRTVNYNKSQFALKLANLYDMKYTANVKEKKGNLIFSFIINYLPFKSNKQFNEEIKNLIFEIINNFYIEDIDLKNIILDYKMYFLQIKDNPSKRAQFEFFDMIYTEDELHLSFLEAQKYLEKIERKDFRQALEILKNAPEFIACEISEKNEILFSDFSKLFSPLSQQIIWNKKNIFISLKEAEKIQLKPKENKQIILQILFQFKNDNYNKYTLKLLNNIFGNETFSKLFLNVREKENICYTIYSREIENIGLMVFTEIDEKNLDLAKRRIIEEFQEIIAGNIDVEFYKAKEKLKLNYISVKDEFNFNFELLCNSFIENTKIETSNEIVKKIELIEKEDIINLASNLVKTKVYISN